MWLENTEDRVHKMITNVARKHRRQSTQNDNKCGQKMSRLQNRPLPIVGWPRANQNNLSFADSFNQINESHLNQQSIFSVAKRKKTCSQHFLSNRYFVVVSFSSNCCKICASLPVQILLYLPNYKNLSFVAKFEKNKIFAANIEMRRWTRVSWKHQVL